MSKRILSLVLALVMVLGTFGTMVFAAPSDVEGTVYESAVERLELLNILEGYPDGTFKPENQITRAEFAAVVVRAKGLEAVAQAAKGLSTGFTDVPATSWASGYVGTAAKLGIINGVGNGKFAPEAPVKYEEAVTMIMRALGYEEAAKARGGYPYGHLIVANEVGLLTAVKGTQGLPALRGTVAQLADNALEVAMMVQVGYGPASKWVVSGSKEHGEDAKYLLDEMGFDVFAGRVTSIDSRNRVTLTGNKEKVVVSVDKDFDFNFVEGLRIKAWYAGGKLVLSTVLDEAIYAPTTKGDKITVGTTKYSVAKDADLVLNNEEAEAKDFTSHYAKVVLNEDNEIVWAKGYTFTDLAIVEKVDGNVVYDYNKVDANLKDYTILKDGKSISIDDLEEQDVLLYNKTEKFAIVYNDSKVGEIERVYSDSFRFEGKVYAIKGSFIDGKVFGALTDVALAAMMAEDKEVEVFFNTLGDVVLVVGNRGVAPSSSFYGKVTYANLYTGRSGSMLALDVLNKDGKKVSYDISYNSTTEKYAGLELADNNDAKALVDKVILVTVNKDEVPTSLAMVDAVPVDTLIKLTDSYVKGYRLQDSTIIFHGTKAVELGNAEGFTQIKENSTIYVNENDRVVAIVGTTNADADVETKTDLVTRVRRLANKTYEFTFANGDRYVTASDANNSTVYENKIVKLTIGKTTGLVTKAEVVPASVTVIVDSRSAVSGTIKVGDDVFELASGAKLYDITNPLAPKSINLIDLAKDDKVEIYRVTGTTRFVNFVVRVPADKKVENGDSEQGLEVEAIDAVDKLIRIDGKTYRYAFASEVELVKVGDKVTFKTELVNGVEYATNIKVVTETPK